MSSAATTHIEIDENGVAWVAGANVKVIEVATDKLAHGSSPEEIHFQFPHLTLAQIHAAFAYYYDHQIELDAQIDTRRREADALAARVADTKLRKKPLTAKAAVAGRASVKTYRRGKGANTWHWCRSCSNWPSAEYEEIEGVRPRAAELCSECLAKESNATCHT